MSTLRRFDETFGASRENADLTRIATVACEEGFAVVPVAPSTKKPMCTLTATQKKAADREAMAEAKERGHRHWERVRHDCGRRHAITEPKDAARIFRRLLKTRPELNIAIEVGRSRVLLVDCDSAAALESFRQRWATEDDDPCLTTAALTVSTPGSRHSATGEWTHSDGGHFWFALPDGLHFQDSLTAAPLRIGDAEIYYKDRIGLLPPSVRPEGEYQLISHLTYAPAWLTDAVAAHVAAHEQRRTEQVARLRHGDDSIDAWAAGVSWRELLSVDGWSDTGKSDTCGCEIWTRPGEDWSNPKSATAHELGCARFEAGGNAPLHLWTDHPPPFLAAYVETTGNTTLSKLTYLAWRDFGGDTSLAMTDLEIDAVSEETAHWQDEVRTLFDQYPSGTRGSVLVASEPSSGPSGPDPSSRNREDREDGEGDDDEEGELAPEPVDLAAVKRERKIEIAADQEYVRLVGRERATERRAGELALATAEEYRATELAQIAYADVLLTQDDDATNWRVA